MSDILPDRYPHDSSRSVAGWLRFFTLTQCFCRPKAIGPLAMLADQAATPDAPARMSRAVLRFVPPGSQSQERKVRGLALSRLIFGLGVARVNPWHLAIE